MKSYLQKISENQDLTMYEAEDAIVKIFKDATDAQIGGFLFGLKMKKESIEEIAGFAKGMKKVARSINPKVSGTLVDTCGTGGDGHGTINVSTASAIVTAAAGVPVAKHGNFSITSKSGSADVLKELGVSIDLEPSKVKECIEKIGIGFMLAPVFHPAMKRVAHVRRELGVRTIFNILGPLTNPANASSQLLGVFNSSLCEPIAEVLNLLGSERALVVHGSGLDEISNIDSTKVTELKNNNIETYYINPEDFGFERARLADIKGGTPQENAKDMVDIFKGVQNKKRDIVVLNSAASILVGGMANNLENGIKIAEEVIDKGRALNKLREFVEFTGEVEKLERYI
ncbi:MAG: anthranilate phosphoribosyltransferase [Methanosarcinales archaeon]